MVWWFKWQIFKPVLFSFEGIIFLTCQQWQAIAL
jgi:hypothetical protein